jgi:hypothetical protein
MCRIAVFFVGRSLPFAVDLLVYTDMYLHMICFYFVQGLLSLILLQLASLYRHGGHAALTVLYLNGQHSKWLRKIPFDLYQE